jgi:hypothetical protein
MKRAVAALLLLVLCAAAARPAERLDPAAWEALKSRVEGAMGVPGKVVEKEAAAAEVGADDSERAARLLVRWAMESERRQNTELLEEHLRREEEFQKLEKLLLKAYDKMPPTQAEHLKSWQTARDLHWKALENWSAEARVQTAVSAALSEVHDAAAVAWAAGEGARTAKGAKYGTAAFLSIVKCVLSNRSRTDGVGVVEWAKPGNPLEARVLSLGWLAEHRPDAGFPVALAALTDASVLVRRSAVVALSAYDDPRAVKPMIDSLKTAGGLLADEIDAALHVFTGQSFESDAALWLRWWTEKGEAWFAKATRDRFDRDARKGGGAVDFYGVQTKSDRVVFVLDRSGSMKEPAGKSSQKPRGPVTGGKDKGEDAPVLGDTKMEVARNQLVKTIDALPTTTSFNVVFFGSDVQVWRAPPQLFPAKPGEKDAAKKWFGGIKPEGSTQLFAALRKALLYAAEGGKGQGGADTIYLLSDGAPTPAAGGTLSREDVEKELESFLDANRAYRCVVHAIGVGPDHSEALMRRIADATGGKYLAVGVE